MKLVITPKGKLMEKPWIIIKGRSLGMTTSMEALKEWYEANDYSAWETGQVFHLVR